MFRVIKLFIWIIIILLWVFWLNYNNYVKWKDCETLNLIPQRIVVEKWENFSTVLQKHTNSDLFSKIYLKLNPPEFSLQAGSYDVITICGIENFLEYLQKPINETDEYITLLEGWNIYDIDKTLSEKWLIIPGDFSSYATNCDNFCHLASTYSFLSETETLEGFLYPDTYAINPNNFTIEGLVQKMLQRFDEKVMQSWILSNLSHQEIVDTLIMASIVQKEANKRDNPKEIALIAGILKKRLEENWMIGADATVCYAYKIATQDCTPAKVLEYLYEKNDYNTRQMIGLPLTPIANPEAEIIQATVESADSPYYYYLHDNSGQIHYGRNGTEHESNKAKYLY